MSTASDRDFSLGRCAYGIHCDASAFGFGARASGIKWVLDNCQRWLWWAQGSRAMR